MLPIHAHLDTILTTLGQNTALVLQAEPGAGKSTALPLRLLEADWLAKKKIVMLEPRRVAARSIAHYLAHQLGEKVGQRVGYQVRNDRKVSSETVLEVVTEGILTRRLQADPELANTALIIFDEFHERSIHADLSLLLALEVQQSLRDDLKLLVMSATIDTQKMAQYLGGAAIVECPGRSFPVTVVHTQPINNKYRLGHQVITEVANALKNVSEGDFLVFLPGQREIKQCLNEANNFFSDDTLEFLPLYGALPLDQQARALQTHTGAQQKRRIIFSTNIAETSLTIEGVTCVIDSGLERVLTYDPASDMTRLETAYISKASAEQRKGRAGRVRAGHCVRLWNETNHHSLKDFQAEEILSADLTPLLLNLLNWGTADYSEINWLTAPPKAHFDSAKATLQILGLTKNNHQLSSTGKQANALPLHPRLAAMVLSANQKNAEASVACLLAALLNEQDIFTVQAGGAHHRSVDITERIIAIQEYHKHKVTALRNYPIRRTTLESLLNTQSNLERKLKLTYSRKEIPLAKLQLAIGALLLAAYPDRLAKQRSRGSGRYQLANGRGVILHEGDPLFDSPWLVVADADGQKREGQIFSAAQVSFEQVKQCLKDHIREQDEFQYDQQKQKITGRNYTRYKALELSCKMLAEIPREKFQHCLHSIVKTQAFELLNWTEKCERWLARAQWLGEQSTRFPALSKASLLASTEQWLLPYTTSLNSISELKKLDALAIVAGALNWEQQQQLEREAPASYTTPSNKQVSIYYDENQGPTVSVALQEMFGELESPKLGGDKVPLRFELLSPARRPIQTTSDLANFWRTSYFEVAKEMRGRYPKHRWPDEPLKEKPGRSIKAKSRR